jgi:hypothetical protein
MDIKAQTQQNAEVTATTGKLLNIQERAVCERLSDGAIPHNQWAQALLAIDEGASRAEAAQRAGLTDHQVRYWLAKFRKQGLGIFPQQALESAAQEMTASVPDAPTEEGQVGVSSEEVEAVEKPEVKADEAKVKPKAKKSKEKKKDKKGKDKSKKKGGKKGKSKKGKQLKKSKKAGNGKSKKAKKNKR